jgi:hypothetical protein
MKVAEYQPFLPSMLAVYAKPITLNELLTFHKTVTYCAQILRFIFTKRRVNFLCVTNESFLLILPNM